MRWCTVLLEPRVFTYNSQLLLLHSSCSHIVEHLSHLPIKNGPIKLSFSIPAETSSISADIGCPSRIQWEFISDQYRVLCLFRVPFNWNVALLETILNKKSGFVSILAIVILQNLMRRSKLSSFNQTKFKGKFVLLQYFVNRHKVYLMFLSYSANQNPQKTDPQNI